MLAEQEHSSQKRGELRKEGHEHLAAAYGHVYSHTLLEQYIQFEWESGFHGF
jgi:hypothetical protein